jgi:hypothetical protein
MEHRPPAFFLLGCMCGEREQARLRLTQPISILHVRFVVFDAMDDSDAAAVAVLPLLGFDVLNRLGLPELVTFLPAVLDACRLPQLEQAKELGHA